MNTRFHLSIFTLAILLFASCEQQTVHITFPEGKEVIVGIKDGRFQNVPTDHEQVQLMVSSSQERVKKIDWLDGKIVRIEYNSSECAGRTLPYIQPQLEEAVKSIIVKGIVYHGARITRGGSSDFVAVVCLSAFYDSRQPIGRSRTAERWSALVNVTILDTSKIERAMARGEQVYFQGTYACYNQKAYAPNSCFDDPHNAFKKAAMDAMNYDLRSL